MDNTEMLDRMRKLILERGYNERSYTRYLGISSTTFSDWRKGSNPSLETVKRISEDLGQSLDFLVYGKNLPQTAQNDLNDSEKILLGSFRQLPLILQDRVIAYVQGVVVGSSVSSSPANEETENG